MLMHESSLLPFIDEAFDQEADVTVFFQTNFNGVYHPMRIREAGTSKTATCARFGSFEWQVLAFGLINAPKAFLRILCLWKVKSDFRFSSTRAANHCTCSRTKKNCLRKVLKKH